MEMKGSDVKELQKQQCVIAWLTQCFWHPSNTCILSILETDVTRQQYWTYDSMWYETQTAQDITGSVVKIHCLEI